MSGTRFPRYGGDAHADGNDRQRLPEDGGSILRLYRMNGDIPSLDPRDTRQMIGIGNDGEGGKIRFRSSHPGFQGQFRTDAGRIALGQEKRALRRLRHWVATPSCEESEPLRFWLKVTSPRVRSSSRSRTVWLRSFSPEVIATSRGDTE